jgi:SAM-dependent methyltransferase
MFPVGARMRQVECAVALRPAVMRTAAPVCACLAAAALLVAPLSAQFKAPRQPDVRYVPTPQNVVDAMLALAQVTAGDVVYDLGSGDGRIPITAAVKYGARGLGVEIEPRLVAEAKDNAVKAGVADRVAFFTQDLFETDLSPATVVTLFLLPRINQELMPKLKQLRPGTRIVSHQFDMGPDWPADESQDVNGLMIYLWTIR